jgi:hypothetical protein
VKRHPARGPLAAVAAVLAACTVCSCAAAASHGTAPTSPTSPVTTPGTAAPVPESSFATPLEATLSWFAAVNAKDRAAADAHFVPVDAPLMMDWGNGDTSTWSTFTRLRCKPLSSGAASATVYCSFDESQSPSEGNPDTFWTVSLARQTDGRWLIDSYGQG